jgi:hypothetical protein
VQSVTRQCVPYLAVDRAPCALLDEPPRGVVHTIALRRLRTSGSDAEGGRERAAELEKEREREIEIQRVNVGEMAIQWVCLLHLLQLGREYSCNLLFLFQEVCQQFETAHTHTTMTQKIVTTILRAVLHQ